LAVIRPPLRTVRNQSSSISSWLSVLSPVVIMKSIGRLVNGPVWMALILFTRAVDVCWASVSCARKAPAPSNGWVYSKRAGLWVSTMCMSVNWTKQANDVRRSARPAPGVARSDRTTSGHPGPACNLR
jgi:hypothetical protein